MKRLNLCLAVAALAAAGVCGTAQAARVGVFIGGGVGVPYYYPVAPVPYYYPYYPPVVAVRRLRPSTMSSRDSRSRLPAPIPEARRTRPGITAMRREVYYPYVKDCPAGWRAVAPQAAPSN